MALNQGANVLHQVLPVEFHFTNSKEVILSEAQPSSSSTAQAAASSSLPSLPSIKPQRLLITGGTGFIGSPLVDLLVQQGCSIVVLSRHPNQALKKLPEGVAAVAKLSKIPAETVFDGVINLAGESLAQGRWTEAKKQRLLHSRIGTTEDLFQWAKAQPTPPKYLMNASAVGYYGPQDDAPLTEDSPPHASFSHELCARWERAAQAFETLGTAVCRLRFGVVLAREGGAFEQIILPYRFKLAPVIGSGQQYFSWIHHEDLMRVFFHLLSQDTLPTGPINATAPEPITYRTMADTLAAQAKTWVTLPAPAFVMRTVLGEMAQELLLTGQRVMPQRLQDMGFEFEYSDWQAAVKALV